MNNTAELKNSLFEFIVNTNDVNILNQIQDYFTQLKPGHTDWWDELSQSQKESVDRGLMQLDKGERIPHEDVKKRIRQLIESKKSG
ncbi:MAG: hypothetical protein GXO89_03920 [Chlorobi bacterium]|nr:hypothetical protein [Chlorobiota bacterium]